MNKVFINGKSCSFSGKNICITNNRIVVDGETIKDLEEIPEKEISVTLCGDVSYLEVPESVTVEGNCGTIDCGGSVTIHGNVGGDISCGGSVRCEGVAGNIDAGGSVRIER